MYRDIYDYKHGSRRFSRAFVAGLLYLIFKDKISSTVLGVITVISVLLIIKLSNLYLIPYYEAWSFESTIKENQIFNLISKQDPTEYKIFTDKVKHNILNKEDPKLVQEYSFNLFQTVFPKYLQKARDSDIYTYLSAQLNVYEYLYKIDPSLVVKLEYGIPIDTNKISNDFIPLMNQLLESKRQIIVGATHDPQNIPNQDEVTSYLVPIIKQLNVIYGDDKIISFYEGKYDSLPVNTAASIIIDFNKLLLTSGPKATGIVVRYTTNQALSDKHH